MIQKGEYEHKEKHMWGECPRNEDSRNKDKKCNEKGELILCIVEKFEEDLAYNDGDLSTWAIINIVDKIDNGFKFYSPLVSNYHGF